MKIYHKENTGNTKALPPPPIKKSNDDFITKLELALKLMQDRRHDVAGLGSPIFIIKDVLEDIKKK